MKCAALMFILAASSVAGVAIAQDPAPKGRPSQCFRSEEYKNFRPINDHAFNIRVHLNDYYRVELQGACPEVLSPDATLITRTRGSDWICDGLDWDLKIRMGPGIPPEPCIVKGQTRLTPDQVAAIPSEEKP